MKIPIIGLLTTLTLLLTTSATAWATLIRKHDSPANARLDASPAQIGITYDDPIDPTLSSMLLLDGSARRSGPRPRPPTGSMQPAVTPNEPLAPGRTPWPGPAWTPPMATSSSFYTFVMNGGSVGIISGQRRPRPRCPRPTSSATLTVTAAEDGGSLLRVDLNDSRAVERVRIRLSRPELGQDCSRPSAPTTAAGR